MTYFLRNGNTYRVSDEAALDLHKLLPPGNYIIKQDMFGNLFLEQTGDFEYKGKLYGDIGRNADRILNTFDTRDASTGVLLNGEKGSGKTLLAKTLSMRGAEKGYPTILINSAWKGDAFNKLIQSIEQSCIVLFDEFEKVYDSNEQESILTLLDGVFPSKKLFILTCNDKWRVDSHMRNRPGRIFYMLDFKGLAIEFIREYCEDNLANKSHIESICKISSLYDAFNFDMLKALVEEMNRYDESPQDALRMLNAKPEHSKSVGYTVEIIKDNVPVKAEEHWNGNPLMGSLVFEYVDGTDEDGDDNWETVRVSPNDLKKIDSNNGVFVFGFANGLVKLTRVKVPEFNYFGAF